MLVVSRRPTFKNQLSRVVAEYASFTFVETFMEADLILLREKIATIVVDLSSQVHADHPRESLEHLFDKYPWLQVVLVVSLDNPAQELDIIREVFHDTEAFPFARRAAITILSKQECADPARWEVVLRKSFVECCAAKIETDMILACPPAALFLVDPEVKRLLRIAPDILTVKQLAGDPCKRFALFARYKELFGRPPSKMLAMLRLVWAAYLRQLGRSPAEIAMFMGFEDAEHLRRQIGGKLKVRKSELNRLEYEEILTWVAQTLGSPGTDLVKVATLLAKRAVNTPIIIISTLMGLLATSCYLTQPLDFDGDGVADLGLLFATAVGVIAARIGRNTFRAFIALSAFDLLMVEPRFSFMFNHELGYIMSFGSLLGVAVIAVTESATPEVVQG